MTKIPNNAIKGIPKARVYDFDIPLYNKSVHIYIAMTIHDAATAAEKEFAGLDLSDVKGAGHIATAVRINNDKGHQGNMMLIAMEYAADYNLLATICHEALHVSWHILDRVGIEIDADNHEAQAYLLDHLFEHCKEALEDYIKRYKLNIKL